MNRALIGLTILVCIPCLAATTATIYKDAKAAYAKDDCQNAIALLQEYEQQSDSDHAKFAAIDSAIGWCRSRLFAVNPHPNVDGDTAGGTAAPAPAKQKQKPKKPDLPQ